MPFRLKWEDYLTHFEINVMGDPIVTSAIVDGYLDCLDPAQYMNMDEFGIRSRAKLR